MITITEEQYDKLRNLLTYADWWIDDYPKHMYPEQYEEDKEVITQGQEVIQDIDQQILRNQEQERRSARTDAWIKEANKVIREEL